MCFFEIDISNFCPVGWSLLMTSFYLCLSALLYFFNWFALGSLFYFIFLIVFFFWFGFLLYWWLICIVILIKLIGWCWWRWFDLFLLFFSSSLFSIFLNFSFIDCYKDSFWNCFLFLKLSIWFGWLFLMIFVIFCIGMSVVCSSYYGFFRFMSNICLLSAYVVILSILYRNFNALNIVWNFFLCFLVLIWFLLLLTFMNVCYLSIGS